MPGMPGSRPIFEKQTNVLAACIPTPQCIIVSLPTITIRWRYAFLTWCSRLVYTIEMIFSETSMLFLICNKDNRIFKNNEKIHAVASAECKRLTVNWNILGVKDGSRNGNEAVIRSNSHKQELVFC